MGKCLLGEIDKGCDIIQYLFEYSMMSDRPRICSFALSYQEK